MARQYESSITIYKDNRCANLLRLMAVLHLGARCADNITVTVEGEDEETVTPIIEEFFKANL